MDVLLVNPEFNTRSEIPPVGLEYIAAVLLNRGIEVSIFDLDEAAGRDGRADLDAIIDSGQPRIVGVSCMSDSFESALDVCRSAKGINQDIMTVMGGMHATVRYDRILREYPFVDAVVRGEGEFAFSELAGFFLRGVPLPEIEGVSCRREGRIIHGPARRPFADLDLLPLPAHGLVDGVNYRTRSISSSRGCFHRCSFCSIRALHGAGVRERSISGIMDEIDLLVEREAKSIMFTDDNFTFRPERVREICGEIIRRGFCEEAVFYAEGRIDDFCRRPLMANWMSRAGFRAVYIGAESGSEEILDYYRKGITPEDLVRGVSFCVEQNLTPVVNFILIGPRDTAGTIRESIGLAKNLFKRGAELAYAEMLVPYPGTPVQEELEKNGKFREVKGAFYFEPYGDLDIARTLHMCDLARETAAVVHAGDPLFSRKKAYLELCCLDSLLEGRMPAGFDELYARGSAGPHGEQITALHGEIVEVIRK